MLKYFDKVVLPCPLILCFYLPLLSQAMKLQNSLQITAALLAFFLQRAAAACSAALKSSYPTPIVSDGWQAHLIAQDLSSPRSILFDSNGGLLVVQQGHGIVHLEFTDSGSTCLEVSQKTYLINSTEVYTLLIILTRGNLLTCVVESRNCALERWKDPLCIFLRRRLLLVLRCESCDCWRYEPNPRYWDEQ